MTLQPPPPLQTIITANPSVKDAASSRIERNRNNIHTMKQTYTTLHTVLPTRTILESQ